MLESFDQASDVCQILPSQLQIGILVIPFTFTRTLQPSAHIGTKASVQSIVSSTHGVQRNMGAEDCILKIILFYNKTKSDVILWIRLFEVTGQN